MLERIPRAVPALVLLPALVAIALLPAWPVERLTPGTFRSRKATPESFQGPDAFFAGREATDIVFYDDDPTSSVSVAVPPRRPGNIALYVNGKPEGALEGDYPTMALVSLIPALIAEGHQNAFVIGLGTGVTAGELAALEGTRKVTVAEISRAVIAANPFFAPGNLGASTHPKVEMIRGDAYRTLLRSGDRYDVIVSEPSNPWVAGVEMLYTREFLEAARSRLAPGGVYGQWFHVYESDSEVVNLILRTYVSVFPFVSAWYTGGRDLLLLGMERTDRALDVRALEARFRQPDFAAGFGRVEIESFAQLLSHEVVPLGVLHAEKLAGPIHTLRRPRLSDLAARVFFVGGPIARIDPLMSANHQKVSVRNALLRRYAGGEEVLPEEILELAAREACRYKRLRDCATWLARWSVDYPKSERWRDALPRLRAGARARIPVLSSQRLDRLHGIYSGKLVPSLDAPPPAEEARRVTDLFLRHYNHVVPFDRRVLEEVWDRCEGEDCAVERAKVEDSVWGLDAYGG
ncbi:MAG: fused MFS/spermidine synthase [Deltaproteobacteria bacterium]|nr:fused MFS/spermidine synthase [Deltaproteobacteria bacterium]